MELANMALAGIVFVQFLQLFKLGLQFLHGTRRSELLKGQGKGDHLDQNAENDDGNPIATEERMHVLQQRHGRLNNQIIENRTQEFQTKPPLEGTEASTSGRGRKVQRMRRRG